MKSILTIAILTLIGQVSLAQKHSIWTEVDTIQKFPDRIYVEYKAYSDSILLEQAEAYFYPMVKEYPKFRLFGNLFTKKVRVDSILFHGERTSYLVNRLHKREIFDNGTLISTTYFNSMGQEISEREFRSKNNVIGPCGVVEGHYFIHGNRKKEEN